jgi:hypothetical protein
LENFESITFERGVQGINDENNGN